MSSHTSKPVPDLHPFEVDRSCFPPLERERGGREGIGRGREREKGRCVVKVIGVESKPCRDIAETSQQTTMNDTDQLWLCCVAAVEFFSQLHFRTHYYFNP